MNAIDETQFEFQQTDSPDALERAMADAAPDAIFAIDEQATILTANRSALGLLGYSLGELRGQSITQIIAPKDRERITRRLTRDLLAAESHSESQPAECTALHKAGVVVPIELTLRQIRGKRPWFIAVIRDLTERRKAVEEMRQIRDALRHSQKMKAVGQLSAGLAHDFNNLLAVIIGFSDVLLEQFNTQDCAHHKVQEIKKAAKRAAALTTQLMSFARQQVVDPRVLDINAVVCDSCKMLESLLGKEIELILLLNPRVGRVLADTQQIEQVIINLSLNARDAMPKGGVLTIETANHDVSEIEAKRRVPMASGSYVKVTVRDTGIGMDAGIQAHLFEPFFTTKALGQGTGLGLATVYGIVKQSGGFIWVDSERGRGTTFEIFLPRLENSPHIESV
jgi:two-component system, cell cycle sensor histidine kinase and response regulator CckA